jgi:hypothetical protein
MPDIWIDVDTALTEVPVNIMPLVDPTDFTTIEESIAYNETGMDLNWHFVTPNGSLTQTNVTPTTAGTHDWTHQGNGMYTLEIPDTGGTINNDTEGIGWFTGVTSECLPFRGPVIGFRASGINDLLIEDTFSATRGLAGTALPNAAADAAGGLIISDAGGLDADAMATDCNDLNDTKIPDTLSLVNINTEVDSCIETYGLQYLFLTAHNPDSPFGNANSWANELTESDGGVTRFTANALEQAGGAAIEAIVVMQSTTIATLASQTSFTLTTASGDDDAYNDRLIVVTDNSTSTQKCVGRISDYTGGTKTVTLAADPGVFTMAVGDTVDILSIGAMDVSLLATQLTTSLATLNDLSAADVNAEVDTALSDYDGPTHAELQTEVATVTHPNLLQSGTITVTSQTEFVLSAGSSDDDAYNGHRIVIEDATTAEQKAVGTIGDYVGSTKTVTLEADPAIFTMATSDKFKIFATADVSALTTSFANINAVANTPVGEVSGFPVELTQGDAYTTTNGREIKLYFKDAAGDTMTSFGSKSPSDVDFTWSIRFVDAGSPESAATMEVTGDENDWITTDPLEPYLQIELPSASMDSLTIDDGYLTKDYLYQVILQWDPSDDHEFTGVSNETITVRRKLTP